MTFWEWIIVDDDSMDSSYEFAIQLSLKDPRVRVFRNEKNSGPSVCRNKGLDESRGEFIAFLDADDLWLPRKLEVQMKFMVDKNLSVSCHSYYLMSETSELIKKIAVPEVTTRNDLRAFNPLATSFMMVRRIAIGSQRFDESLRRRQDWIFWYHLVGSAGNCVSLAEPLGKYRKDSQHSISKNKIHMARIQWGLYRDYFRLDFLSATISFIRYALHGVKKHFLNY